ncbi:FUSC family protein [Flammeovirga sp. SubArs3]|uniref:FUSC family protein n=1 Tax=Flammeovirga sp. SubArs3 TaxID=2995316 RepID=UPI00248C5E94|nr:FUSC family protein [Flammeovirga sp. SubArs3]
MSKENIRESLKAALALVIAYGISLSQNWYDPAWAGFAVAMVAMPMFKIEDSIKKALLRFLGTIPGSIGGLIVISLAPQNRFLFMAIVCIWIGLSTYMMIADKKHSYFWNVVGFTMLIISTTVTDSESTMYQHALYRIMENITGIVVYTVVSLLVAPNFKQSSASNSLKKVLVEVSSIFDYLNTPLSHSSISEEFYAKIKSLESTIIALEDEIAGGLFDDKIHSSNKKKWNQILKEVKQITETITSISVIKKDIYHINQKTEVVNFDPIFKQVKDSIRNLEDIIDGETVEVKPLGQFATPNFNKSLSHLGKVYQQGLVNEYNNLHRIISNLQDSITFIFIEKEKEDKISIKEYISEYFQSISINRDYMKRTMYVVIVTGSSFLIWLLFNPPGHIQWYSSAGVNAMAIANTPQMKGKDLLWPYVWLCIGLTIVYTLILPEFNSFAGLAFILFIYMFLQHMYLRGFAYIAASLGLMMIGFSNGQQYNFYNFINSNLFDILYVFWVIVIGYFLSSTRAEKLFVQKINRFFKSANILLENSVNNTSLFNKNLLLTDIKTIPKSLDIIKDSIDYQYFNQVKKDELDQLIMMLFSVSKRLQYVIEKNENNKYCQKDLEDEVALLVEEISEQLKLLSKGNKGDTEDIFSTLMMSYKRITTSVNEEELNSLNVLSSYSIFYEALYGYIHINNSLKISTLKEERFS